MKREIKAVVKAKNNYDSHFSTLEVKIQEVCDFKAYLTYCEGDGHLVGNEDTANIAPLECLIGKTTKNKLSEDDHEKQCI